jgi:hypothetical protein
MAPFIATNMRFPIKGVPLLLISFRKAIVNQVNKEIRTPPMTPCIRALLKKGGIFITRRNLILANESFDVRRRG